MLGDRPRCQNGQQKLIGRLELLGAVCLARLDAPVQQEARRGRDGDPVARQRKWKDVGSRLHHASLRIEGYALDVGKGHSIEEPVEVVEQNLRMLLREGNLEGLAPTALYRIRLSLGRLHVYAGAHRETQLQQQHVAIEGVVADVRIEVVCDQPRAGRPQRRDDRRDRVFDVLQILNLAQQLCGLGELWRGNFGALLSRGLCSTASSSSSSSSCSTTKGTAP
mmetsp:Transcript_13610/g.37467  ORF Transcript_13610/g.37467 Transcript_13610/m.37467 type:complete len:222 (-) Transcript_13610:203-868(-)